MTLARALDSGVALHEKVFGIVTSTGGCYVVIADHVKVKEDNLLGKDEDISSSIGHGHTSRYDVVKAAVKVLQDAEHEELKRFLTLDEAATLADRLFDVVNAFEIEAEVLEEEEL